MSRVRSPAARSRSRAGAAALAAPLLALAGCHGGGEAATGPHLAETVLTVTVRDTMTGRDRVVPIRNARAGFYPYSPGPTPESRAVYVAVGTGTTAVDSGGSILLFLFLPDRLERPTPGTYPVNIGASSSTFNAGVYFRWLGDLAGRQPDRTQSTITLDTVTATRIVGRLSVIVNYANAGRRDPDPGQITVTAAFAAARAATYVDLPVTEGR